MTEWKLLDENCNLVPIEGRWQGSSDCLTPIPTDRDVAPGNILKIVRCKCEDTSKNQCGSCQKNGLECISTCGECHGD